MSIELHTDNLIIKKPSEVHLNFLIKELNNWNISQWLVNVPFPYTIDDAKYWLKKTKADDYCFNIFIKNILIGGISITNKKNNTNPELGYWIGEDYWGKGYANEACTNLIKYFFLNTSHDIIFASHMKGNIKSKKILINLGFKFVKTGKKFSISRNETVDDLDYQLIKS